jgi:hypothetical protein
MILPQQTGIRLSMVLLHSTVTTGDSNNALCISKKLGEEIFNIFTIKK